MQSLGMDRGSGSSTSSHMHHPHGLVCRNLWPTSFRPAAGKSTILGLKLKNLSQSRQLTAKHEVEVNRILKKGYCRAALPDDAPFALAIGASVLSTLVFPVGREQEDNKESSLFGPDDVRSGAMQIISFIPLFNWLVWVFAWLDTRQSRYLAYTAVYLAPYLRTGLSISPDDSWLPVASVLACIVHVQLDISVNVEGAQSPLGDISKVVLEKAKMKGFGSTVEDLAGRLRELAEKSDSQPIDTEIVEDEQKKREEWKAIQEEALKDFAEWDAKLATSKETKERGNEIDS